MVTLPSDFSMKPLISTLMLAALFLILGLLPIGLAGAASSTILINAVYYDTYLSGEPDEAFQLINVSASSIDLTNWTITDLEAILTLSGALGPGQAIWIVREAADFTLEFGFKPDFEYQSDTDPTVPDLARSGTFALSNSGGELLLRDANNALVDSVVYEDGEIIGTDWSGATIEPYDQGFFGLEGQILYRKLDPVTAQPVVDTDTASDWAQAIDDDLNGKKVQYPGWDLDRYFFTHKITQTATITYIVAPDAIYDEVADYLTRATQSIYFEGYTFKNAHLADIISARLAANPGMTVTMRLEGAPVGGIEEQEKRNCQVVEAAGGQGWVHTGSINGSENSSKQNRELAVQVKSTAGHDYLAEMFWQDWVSAGGQRPTDNKIYLPVVLKND